MRPARGTIRGNVAQYKSALAHEDGECPSCGEAMEQNEPIYLVGVSFIEGPRPRKVDLSDAEWVCVDCLKQITGV